MRCWTNLNVAECEALEQPHVHMCSQRIRQRCEANVTGGTKPACFDRCHVLTVDEPLVGMLDDELRTLFLLKTDEPGTLTEWVGKLACDAHRLAGELKRCQDKYPALVAKIRPVARACGYAVAVHGSEARDLDIISVPWTEEAVPAAQLVAQIAAAVESPQVSGPKPLPWGRQGYVICVPGSYIDLAVWPPLPVPPVAAL
jgi:hypothetical protein